MQLTLSADDLRPVVEQVVAEMLDRFGDAQRVALTEPEAAAALGVRPHVLRDARLRGEIVGSKIGRSYSYTRRDLVQFVERRRAPGVDEPGDVG